MADSYAALAKTTTATTGTLDYVLATTALTTPHRTPKQAVADGSLTDGDIVQYMVRDTKVIGDASFELGEGVYTDATNEIARDAANVHDGSNGPGALTVWPGSGQRDIYLVVSPSAVGARTDRENIFTLKQTVAMSSDGDFMVLDRTGVSVAAFNISNGELNLVYSRVAGTCIVDFLAIPSDGTSNALFRFGLSSGSTGPNAIQLFDNNSTLIQTQLASSGVDSYLNAEGGNLGVGFRTPSTNAHIQESNTDTTPAVEIEQLSTGDAALQFSIVGDAMAQGFDNDDSDKYVFSYAASAGGAVLGTNNRIEIDSAGDVNVVNDLTVGGVPVDRFAAGTAMVFKQAAAPTGWTQSVADNDAALRVVSGTPGASAGSLGISSSVTGAQALTVANLAVHTHGPGGSATAFRTEQGAGASAEAFVGGGATFGTDALTATTGSGSTHTHPLALKYIDVMVATKDA